MRLAPELNQQINQLVDQADTDGSLAAFRAANRDKLAEHLLPSKFAETWKYTKLHQLADGQLQQQTGVGEAPTDLPDFGSQPLVIVNGRLPEQLPEWDGITLNRLTADDSPQLGSTTFAYLNGATLTDGLALHVAKNTAPEGVVHIVFHSTDDKPSHHNTRLVIELESGSRLQIIEHYTGSGPVLCNAVTEVVAKDNSELVHCRLQSEAADTLHIGQLAIRQQAHSRVNSFQFMRGSHLRRNDVKVTLEGEGAELNMHGAFISRQRNYVDNQICVEHHVPHCVSNQSYKGIAGDKGRIVFNGRILIQPGAKKTLADLSNKNLLLTRGAEIDSKPELEIYNDDVMCSHGTTIGQIDPAMTFYLQSRGIDEATAQRMLSTGFIQQELAELPFEPVADWVGNWLGDAVTEAE